MYAYYKFKEGSEAYVYDYSSNSNTAVVLNADVNGIGDGKFWNTPGNLLKDVSLVDEKIPAEFDEASKTYKGVMGQNASLNAVTTKFTAVQQAKVTVGTTPQVSGITTNNFSSNPGIDYTVEGIGFNTGIRQVYRLNVAKDLSSACTMDTYSFEAAANNLSANIVLEKNGSTFYKKMPKANASALKSTFKISPNAKLVVNDAEQTNPQSTPTDYSAPVLTQVVSENGRFINNYLVDLDARSDLAELSSFTIPECQVGNTEINKANHTVTIWVSSKTNLSRLTPSFSVSPKASLYIGPILQKSGITTNSFLAPARYTIVSEDETNTADWIVTIGTDDTKPVITLKGESSITLATGSIYTEQGATATDNRDGDITSRITTSGTVNTNAVGTYTITYTVSDASGNTATVSRTVTVTDQIKPVILLKGSSTIETSYGEPFTDPGASATDNTDGDLSSKITVTGTVSTNVIGTYTIIYNVTDAAGNTAIPVTRTVVVGRGTAQISITNTKLFFDGKEKGVTVSTVPANLNVTVTYNNSTRKPVEIGTYDVVAIVNDPNYQGSANSTFEIMLWNFSKDENANSAYVYASGGTVYVYIKDIKQSASIKIFNTGGSCIFESTTMNIGMNQIKKNFYTGVHIISLTVDGVVYKKKVVIVK